MRLSLSRRAVFGALLFAFAACGEETPSGRSAPIAPVSPGASSAGAGAALPCDVAKVVADRCQLCHAATPQFGAPMPLTTRADFLAPAKSDPTRLVHAVSVERIHADSARVMPPLTQPPLMPTELSALDAWLAAGAPASPVGACSAAPPIDTGGTAGTGKVDPPPTAGTGSVTPPASTEELECFTFKASSGDKVSKFAVPTKPDSYHCFNFARPFGPQAQAVSFKSMIDNSASVHHWILYSTGLPVADGTNTPCSASHPDGSFLNGWAPGTQDRVLPPDVGMLVPGQGLQLEIHYNAPGAGQLDATGVEVCVAKKPRQHAAAIHPLGQEGFATPGPGDVTGTCRPQGPFPITILTSNPHMHKNGAHMKTIIRRATGGMEMVVDKPFDFGSQLIYDTPATVNAGDTLTTTCTFNAPSRFGTGTVSEMCYNFVLAYPAGALAGGNGLSNNGNICIDDPQFASIPLP